MSGSFRPSYLRLSRSLSESVSFFYILASFALEPARNVFRGGQRHSITVFCRSPPGSQFRHVVENIAELVFTRVEVEIGKQKVDGHCQLNSRRPPQTIKADVPQHNEPQVKDLGPLAVKKSKSAPSCAWLTVLSYSPR